MSIFKKKINFPQFLFEVIKFQIDFLEEHFDKLIVLADELKVLTNAQKKDFFDKAHELVVVNILMGCNIHFSKKQQGEEAGEAVSIVYGKYLWEHKKLPMESVDTKMQKVMELFELWGKAEEKEQKRDEHAKEIGYKRSYEINNYRDKMKLYLCQAFCDYCVGEDVKSENWKGRHFAAFKFAKAIVLSDIVGRYLKEVKVTFS